MITSGQISEVIYSEQQLTLQIILPTAPGFLLCWWLMGGRARSGEVTIHLGPSGLSPPVPKASLAHTSWGLESCPPTRRYLSASTGVTQEFGYSETTSGIKPRGCCSTGDAKSLPLPYQGGSGLGGGRHAPGTELTHPPATPGAQPPFIPATEKWNL